MPRYARRIWQCHIRRGYHATKRRVNAKRTPKPTMLSPALIIVVFISLLYWSYFRAPYWGFLLSAFIEISIYYTVYISDWFHIMLCNELNNDWLTCFDILLMIFSIATWFLEMSYCSFYFFRTATISKSSPAAAIQPHALICFFSFSYWSLGYFNTFIPLPSLTEIYYLFSKIISR